MNGSPPQNRGLTAIDGQLWTAGLFDDGGSNLPFVEHR